MFSYLVCFTNSVGTFLQAEWRNLAMANYVVDAAVLKSWVPAHTTLDTWNDMCYVSLVGFMFQNTKVLGMKIPFHIHFEEVNLRFYVQHKNGNEWRRGVVFIKEIVPKPALTFVANTVYHERYQTMSMQHTWVKSGNELSVEYRWKKSEWNSLRVLASANSEEIPMGSEAEFITEHYWGYTQVNATQTLEYQVSHPRWRIHPVSSWQIQVDFANVYGAEFAFLKTQDPVSVFLAEGSEISVMKATKINAPS